jgi:two-component system, chemotaxis family, protein-glutamate methylesterase/glutaminase
MVSSNASTRAPGDIARKIHALPKGRQIQIVAIGVSTGGPQALNSVIPKLPGLLGVPIVMVQHMPTDFTAALAGALNRKSQLTVVEARSGQVLEPNTVYLAPGGKQMKVTRTQLSPDPIIIITDDPPESFCKPSADYLFRSVADIYQGHSLGVVMTGMGHDGAAGLRLMKAKGARVIAQDEETSVVFGMPMEAINAGVVDLVLPLDQIAPAIAGLVQKI